MESLENDCDITLIKSKYMKDFLSKISPEGNLPQETGFPSSFLDLPYLEDKDRQG